ncbi:MAG: PfkB family carbohydrate kinase [Solirubrobacteraceae bacterium]
MKGLLQLDYTAVGHVTIDVLADGSRRPGGTAFYSALQAARLGASALIVTQGVAREIEELLEPYRSELELRVLPARHTTTLQTSGWGPARAQRMRAWAGPIEDVPRLSTAILHLAPIAREAPSRWRANGAFVGLTPQGMARQWLTTGSQISLSRAPRAGERLAARCHALVLSEHERSSCEALIEAALDNRALVTITAESQPSTVLTRDRAPLSVAVPALARAIDDLGAGDVFAACLFVALADGIPPERAVAFATAGAAVRMSGAGAGAIGDRALIDARLQAVAA